MVKAIDLIKEHERYRRKTLNLIPSENILSPLALKVLSTDLAGRYSHRPEYYGGTRFIQELWNYAEELTRKLFKAEYVLLEPIAGHIAAILTAYTFATGGKLAALPAEQGGYPGYEPTKIPDLLKIDLVRLPGTSEYLLPLVEESLEVIRREKPELLVLGGSMILFPHPVRELSEAVHEYGGVVAYDASHVLGLIAGGQFQDPLREGADILYASTHKTFPGPQGALILTNDEKLYERLRENIYHKIVDNIHLNRLAAFAITLEEMRRFGKAYAKRIVENSYELASALDSMGVSVKAKDKGYTKSHQVVLNIPESEARIGLRNRLEECGIITDGDLRLGTGEISRRGMGKREMRRIARLIYNAMEGADPKIVRRRVAELMRRFSKPKFCYLP